MRRSIPLIILALALAGCAKQENDPSHSDTSAASESLDAMAKNDAPGVKAVAARSYSYDYSFGAPAAQIATAQERHAQACEALGPDQCVVTGMTLDNGDVKNVHAALDLAIAPALARSFGSKASVALGQLGGRLLSARIESEDQATPLANLSDAGTARRAELAEIARRLAQPGLSARERVGLQQRAQALRDELGEQAVAARSARGQLRVTPMHFDYRPLATGWFDGDSPLANGYAIGRDSLTALLAVLLLVVAGGLPWALVAIALLLTLRWGRRRLAPVLG